MYAGHFAPVTLLHSRYPNVSPYVLAVGVCFLDITFGLLSFFGVEGFTKNDNAQVLGVNIHCDYSHSIVGSVILSVFYGVATGTPVPGFLASFSHFIGDWLVHDSDLPLDPFSKIMVGGTGLWKSYPVISFFFEVSLCVICAIFASKDKWTLLTNAFIVTLHLGNAQIVHRLLDTIMEMDTASQQRYICLVILSSFMIPAMLIGYFLQRANKEKALKKD